MLDGMFEGCALKFDRHTRSEVEALAVEALEELDGPLCSSMAIAFLRASERIRLACSNSASLALSSISFCRARA
jgi:hypothetical protein